MHDENVKSLEATLALKTEAIVGESPVWSVQEKVLYWVDITRGEIHRFNPRSGKDERFRLEEPVSAIALRKKGGLVITMRDGFAFFDPETGKLEMINDPESDMPDNRFNDAKCDPRADCGAGRCAIHNGTSPRGAFIVSILISR